MWTLFTQPENISFAVALAIMAMLGILELINLFVGGVSDWLDQLLPESLLDHDTDLHVDASGAFVSFLAWLYVGRVPVLMWLVVFLAIFGITGLVLQSVWFGITASYLSAVLVSFIVLVLSLPLVRFASQGLYKVLPKDETTAIHSDTMIGMAAQIILGEARQGYPAQAKLTDQFGQVHYVMIEPDQNQILAQGSEVLLVSKEGTIFKAIPKDNA